MSYEIELFYDNTITHKVNQTAPLTINLGHFLLGTIIVLKLTDYHLIVHWNGLKWNGSKITKIGN